MKDIKSNIGSFSTNAPAMLKKAQKLFFLFINMPLENRFYLKLLCNNKILSFRYNSVLEWIHYCLIQ